MGYSPWDCKESDRSERLTRRAHLETFLVVTTWGEGAPGIRWLETQPVALPPTHTGQPHNKEQSSRKVQGAEPGKPCSEAS